MNRKVDSRDKVTRPINIGVLLGVLGGAAAPPSCWRSQKFLDCRKLLGVGQKFS